MGSGFVNYEYLPAEITFHVQGDAVNSWWRPTNAQRAALLVFYDSDKIEPITFEERGTNYRIELIEPRLSPSFPNSYEIINERFGTSRVVITTVTRLPEHGGITRGIEGVRRLKERVPMFGGQEFSWMTRGIFGGASMQQQETSSSSSSRQRESSTAAGPQQERSFPPGPREPIFGDPSMQQEEEEEQPSFVFPLPFQQPPQQESSSQSSSGAAPLRQQTQRIAYTDVFNEDTSRERIESLCGADGINHVTLEPFADYDDEEKKYIITVIAETQPGVFVSKCVDARDLAQYWQETPGKEGESFDRTRFSQEDIDFIYNRATL